MKHWIHNLIAPGKNEKGAVIIIAAILLPIFIGFAALAIDTGYLMVTKNELQNAADAGALAGAGVLLDVDGTLNIPAAIDKGTEITASNGVGNKTVSEIIVEAGHWSFGVIEGTRGFTPASPGATQVEWRDRSFEELDADTGFINAVRVQADRSDTPSFFSKIFGKDVFTVNADAVAYIGFVGTQYQLEIDFPIAICSQALEDGCSVGRMIGNSETAAWTDLNQCSMDNTGGAVNAPEMEQAVERGCQNLGANLTDVQAYTGISTNNGQIQGPAFDTFYDCWRTASENGTIPMDLRLPVIDCLPNIAPCNIVTGAVVVRVLWATETGEGQVTAPYSMAGWGDQLEGQPGWTWDTLTYPDATKEERWESFRDHFNLENLDGSPADLSKKSIYFMRDCTKHDISGGTGGENYGLLADVPVLVE